MHLHHHHDAKVEMLAKIEIFRHCNADELSALASSSTGLHLPAGSVLCRQGSIGREFLVIVEGEVAVEVDGRQVATVGQGSFVGEQALLAHSSQNATVTALTPLSVLVLNPGEFGTLLHDAPHAATDILIEASQRSNAPDSTIHTTG